MTWQEDLAAHIAGGHGLTLGSAVVIGPPEDDDGTDDLCVGLVDRPGPVDETYGRVWGRPNLTIVVRSNPDEPVEGWLLAKAIWDDVVTIANTTIGSTELLRVQPRAYPGRLRRDSRRRVDWTMEVEVWLG